MKLFKVLVCASALALVSCADKQVREEVAQEVKAEPVHKRAYLYQEAIAAVEKNPNYTAEQKQRLADVIERTHKRSAEISSEDSKLKGVLIKTIMATPYKDAEVAEIKNQLLKVGRERIKNEMTALNEVRHILGKDMDTDRELIYRQLLIQGPASMDFQ